MTETAERGAGATRLIKLYTTWTDIMGQNPDIDLRLLRAMFEGWGQVTGEPAGVTYTHDLVGGIPGLWALPADADDQHVIIFAHGGGFTVGSSDSHRKLAGHLGRAARAATFVPDYRLAPENPHPAQLSDLLDTYRALLVSYEPKQFTFAGDSAGGNLAIALALYAPENGLPGPGRVVAFSPWLDMECKGETLETNIAADALISGPIVEGMSGNVLGGTVEPTSPLANPLYADLTGFPRLYVNVGEDECLLDNATKLVALARNHDVDVTLHVAQGMQHVYPFLAGNDPDVDREIEDIGRWVRK